METRPTPIHSPFLMGDFSLKIIWEMWADRSHVVMATSEKENEYVVVRTLKGAGRLEFEGEEAIVVDKGSVAFISNKALKRFRCIEDKWIYWWFEVDNLKSDFAPQKQYYQVSPIAGEKQLFSTILENLKHPGKAQRALANAGFLWLLTQWVGNAQNIQPRDPKEENILSVVEEIHERLPASWDVLDMCKHAGMSERVFRDSFTRLMGQPPSVYADKLRIHYAENMLKHSKHSIAEVATQMDFNCPYYFSKWFKKHTGKPPSKYRGEF